ncbi:MAG: creatininase family protein [Armatimonadota bacterium]
MSWKWEELTAPVFADAVKEVNGTCVVPIAVLEKHGGHLPLGMDMLFIRDVAERAAALEPAIIFPPYYFGQIAEGRHWPGTVAIPHRLQFDLLENTCQEIARNGMKKIILLNGHGGNELFLPNFAVSVLDAPRDYTVFVIRLRDYLSPVLESQEWKDQMVSEYDLHGGEMETSMMMGVNPDLVKLEAAVPEEGKRLGRLAHLPGVFTGLFWYADFPNHFAGDPTHATPRKGEFLLQRLAEQVANVVKAVKADTVTPQLAEEFYGRCEH